MRLLIPPQVQVAEAFAALRNSATRLNRLNAENIQDKRDIDGVARVWLYELLRARTEPRSQVGGWKIDPCFDLL